MDIVVFYLEFDANIHLKNQLNSYVIILYYSLCGASYDDDCGDDEILYGFLYICLFLS